MKRSHASPKLTFSHFGVNVVDLAKMEDFYTRVMGFTVTDRGSTLGLDIVFLSRDPAEHHQIIFATGRPETLPPNTANQMFGPVVNQISFRMDSLTDLRKLLQTLKDEGIEGTMALDHGIGWSLYFPDPEGNLIECFVDSEWYIPQPVAEPFDLSRSDGDIRKSTEARCRQTPGFEPIASWRARMADKMRERVKA